MLHRLQEQLKAEEKEQQRRAELYPDEIQHAGHGVVSWWRCRRCGTIYGIALDSNVKSLRCRRPSCRFVSVINRRKKITDEQAVQWHDRPVI